MRPILFLRGKFSKSKQDYVRVVEETSIIYLSSFDMKNYFLQHTKILKILRNERFLKKKKKKNKLFPPFLNISHNINKSRVREQKNSSNFKNNSRSLYFHSNTFYSRKEPISRWTMFLRFYSDISQTLFWCFSDFILPRPFRNRFDRNCFPETCHSEDKYSDKWLHLRDSWNNLT